MVRPGRRRFLQAGVGGAASVPFILSGYGATVEAGSVQIQELTLPFGCSVRVVQITDLHAGVFMTRREIRRCPGQAASLHPKLFVLMGDFVSNSLSFLPGCLEEMARVQPRYGTFATLGNHEHWYGGLNELQAMFRNAGSLCSTMLTR